MAVSKSKECLEYKNETLPDGILETYSGNLTYNSSCNTKSSDLVFAVSKSWFSKDFGFEIYV